ncbi:MAG: CAP domain-containing protein [Ruminococcus sp.]|jgi:uncharacterized protein YkwD|nr:CAP domain-containing protein [Ruminococcus sp.]
MNVLNDVVSVIMAVAVLFSSAYRNAGDMSPETADQTADQTAVMTELVNELRGGVGAADLTLDPKLCEAADIRAKEIAQSFSHTRPNGQSCFTVFADAGINISSYRTYGENIAAGSGNNYKTADGPFASWKNSSGHYANMVSRDFTLIGIGSYSDGKMTYWVQLFAAEF